MSAREIRDIEKSPPGSETENPSVGAKCSAHQSPVTEDASPLPTFFNVPPKAPPQCPIEHILYGPPVTPEQHIKGYSDNEFENFIREWAFYYKQIKEKTYAQVGRFGGAGDMGRDVVGYIDAPSVGGQLDIYQCKHYGHGLQPGEIWAELGKLCYYTFIGAFAIPQRYRFVCPADVGPELGLLLEKPHNLKERLLLEWEKNIQGEIIKKRKISLDGKLLEHVQAFDFRCIGYKPIHEIVQEFNNTPRYPARFGGGLIVPRSPIKTPPPLIEDHEQRYIDQLIEAYRDHVGDGVQIATLYAHPDLETHFARSRIRYFCAESLRLDVRDNLPDGITFEQVQDQVLDAVSDICDDCAHSSGLVRANAVTNHAGNYVLQDHPLRGYVNSQVLKGVCHQLANHDKLKWVKK